MAELVFFTGTMDCGKSTLALQLHHTHQSAGRRGLLLTRHDRAGAAVISSRLGLSAPAVEAGPHLDLAALVVARLTAGEQVDHVICDEAQFLTPAQVEQLAALVDDHGVDVFAFGITTDFRTCLFPGSARLVELADRVETLPVHAWCWCGARATHNARTRDGRIVRDGVQVLPGDLDSDVDIDVGGDVGVVAEGGGEVHYEVLCRRHHLAGVTRRGAAERGLDALDGRDRLAVRQP